MSRQQSGIGHRYLRSFEMRDKAQLSDWRSAVRADPGKYWLLKPCDGGASKGIKIFHGQEAIDAQASFGAHTVAQEYVEDHFLGFGARKFHLRLYFLVTRWDPIGVYLYDGGLVFRSVHKHDENIGPSEERDVFSSISNTV